MINAALHTSMPSQTGDVGLALSGGGSRAMAFHAGTVHALHELGLLPRVDVVSTVSGGSVFGAAWACALADGRETADFLAGLDDVLARGFVRDALLSPRALRVFCPGWNRTRRLAEVFNERLGLGRPLDALPASPTLCINVTVLNHGQVGRFARTGFSCRDLGPLAAGGSYPEVPLEVDVGFATAASAAFPFGLPPLQLDARRLPIPLTGALAGHRRLVLTDGGVLENLGVQTLLKSRRFGVRHLVVSDAGTAEGSWQPTLAGYLWNLLAFAVTPDTLSQLLQVMNSKQNRSMRELLVHELGVIDEVDAGRGLLFVRVNQTWSSFLVGISASHRRRLAGGTAVPDQRAPSTEVDRFLDDIDVDLRFARSLYDKLGDAGARRTNQVATSFTGLAAEERRLLALHSRWQVHAAHAVYGLPDTA